jgi:hypothetical protein
MLISERVTPKDFAVTFYSDLLKHWVLMCWKEDLTKLLNIQFSSFAHLWTCARSWWKQQYSFQDFRNVNGRGCNFYHELMGVILHACKTTQIHKIPPRWRLGILTLCQQTKYIPKILTCGIVNLAEEILKPYMCASVHVNERMVYKQRQYLHQILRSILIVWLSNFSIPIKIY